MTEAYPGARDAPRHDGPDGSAQHRSDPSSARVAVVAGGSATGTAVVERLLSEPPAVPGAGAPREQGPGGAPVPARRRRWPWWTVGALALACAGAVAAWLLLGPGLGGPDGRVAVSGSGGSQVLTVTNGSMSVEQLDDLLAQAGQPRALQRTGGAYLLTTDLVVGPGAEVTVARTALLLRSDARRHVRLSVADGGHLVLDGDTVVAWAGGGAVDTDVADGRADLVAEGAGSRLDVTGSALSHLGADAEDPGLSWRSGAAGSLVDSSVDRSFRGAYAYRSGAVEVRGSRITRSAEDGLVLRSPGSGSSVASTLLAGNRGDGLVLRGADEMVATSVRARDNGGDGVSVVGAVGLRLEDTSANGNAGAGLALDDVTTTTVAGATSWANGTGILLAEGRATVTGARLSANVADGVLVRGEGTRLTLRDSRLDHNERAGLWVAGSAASVAGSTFDRNDTGMRVDAPPATLVARGNTVVDSVRDGLALVDGTEAGISGNTISGSGLAAVSVASGDPAPVLAANTLRGDQEATRVRDDG